MEILASAGAFGGFLGYLIPFLVVLTVIVFVHEYGHFWVARRCGVAVEAFSIGFGPEIFGWNDRHGTRWKVCWLPLGGYVKFMGDDNAASVPDQDAIEAARAAGDEGNFHLKPLWARAAVVAAGPIANFLLAIVIFAFMFAILGERIVPPRVDEVRPDSAAEAAGFLPGDTILEVDGAAIEQFSDIQRAIQLGGLTPHDFLVERAGGGTALITASPREEEIEDPLGNMRMAPILGISAVSGEETVIRRADPLTALWMGVEETWFIIDRTLAFLGRLIIGEEDADEVGGPIRIAQISGQAAQAGLGVLINIAAVLSVSIGLINLFPIPLLDGGHLLFYAFEAVRGKPLGERAQEVGFRIGLAFVLFLMIFATWNDLSQLRVFEYLRGLFS